MSLPWVVELHLPEGLFFARQLSVSRTEASLDAEIRSSYALLQTSDAPSLGSESHHGAFVSSTLQVPPSVRLMLAYHGLDTVAIQVADALALGFPNPQRPWTSQQVSQLLEILRRHYAFR